MVTARQSLHLCGMCECRCKKWISGLSVFSINMFVPCVPWVSFVVIGLCCMCVSLWGLLTFCGQCAQGKLRRAMWRGQQWSDHMQRPNVSVLVHWRWEVGGPQQLNVGPLGLQTALHWCVVGPDHRVFETKHQSCPLHIFNLEESVRGVQEQNQKCGQHFFSFCF